MERLKNKEAFDSVLSKLVLLGDPRLEQVCEPVTWENRSLFPIWKEEMHQVMEAVRKKYKFGRAIAAPQLGILKRVVYLNIEKPKLLLNPVINKKSEEMLELWDDCMSFPNLLVKLRRHKRITLHFKNENWKDEEWQLEDDLSELLQHECDHLDGILATTRAIDKHSFKWRNL